MPIKFNVIANLTGSAWAALISLIFVPFYITLMGIESYGIVGLFASLVGILAILDLGLSQTMNREMARLSALEGHDQIIADTARTLEVIYWLIALSVMAVIFLLSKPIVYHWLNPEELSREVLLRAFWLIALVIGLRWPIALYVGGLNGLQRQVAVNMVLIIFSTLQGAGALAVLWLIEPSIQAFFIWQAVITLLQVVVLRSTFLRGLSRDHSGKFSIQVLHNIWQFAAGITGISLMATILTQLDKVLLSKLLSLADFGYYAFATAVAMVLYRIIGPIFTAYYPRLTELVTKGDQPGLIHIFHQGCQLMAVAILPVSVVLALFAKDVLEVWTHNPDVVEHSSLLISMLIVGNAINGLMHLPYALQLSHAWTKLVFYMNFVAVIILAPAIYFATLRWGATGAAGVWIALNCGYLIIGIQIMFKKLLPAEKKHWYMKDVAKVLLATLLVAGAARLIPFGDFGDLLKILILASVMGLATIAAFLSAETLGKRSLLLVRGDKG